MNVLLVCSSNQLDVFEDDKKLTKQLFFSLFHEKNMGYRINCGHQTYGLIILHQDKQYIYIFFCIDVLRHTERHRGDMKNSKIYIIAILVLKFSAMHYHFMVQPVVSKIKITISFQNTALFAYIYMHICNANKHRFTLPFCKNSRYLGAVMYE